MSRKTVAREGKRDCDVFQGLVRGREIPARAGCLVALAIGMVTLVEAAESLANLGFAQQRVEAGGLYPQPLLER